MASILREAVCAAFPPPSPEKPNKRSNWSAERSVIPDTSFTPYSNVRWTVSALRWITSTPARNA